MMHRRQFLTSTLTVGAGWLLTQLTGCDSPSGDPIPLPPDPPNPNVVQTIQKGPYVQYIGPASVRLRFETAIDELHDVQLTVGQETATYRPETSTETLEYRRPSIGRGSVPDVPGDHTLHTLILDDVPENTPVQYVITQKDGVALKGAFTRKKDQAFTLGWIADTMFPFASDAIRILADQAPDLVIHGGDITYDPSPFDSWNRVMQEFRPLFAQAPVHFIVGNHEFESQNEISVQFDRLFGGQGVDAPNARYHTFTYGHVAFLCLDSESNELGDAQSAQRIWLKNRLEEAAADPAISEIIVGFHRPTFSCGKRWIRDTTVRDALHALFLEFGVRLVLCGHEHAYERFVVDGVHYVIDGGGGALTDDPQAGVDELEATRPGESALQLVAERSYGVTVLEFLTDGSIEQRRLNIDGETTDSFVLSGR